jgi:hypothetical protein
MATPDQAHPSHVEKANAYQSIRNHGKRRQFHTVYRGPDSRGVIRSNGGNPLTIPSQGKPSDGERVTPESES